MMQISVSDLERFLTSYGWKYHVLNKHTIATWFEIAERIFDVVIYSFDGWIQIEIPNFVHLSLSTDDADPLCDLLVALNGKMLVCKFNMEDDHSVSFVVELFSDGLDYSIFSEALELLITYLERYSAQIFEIYDPT